MAMFGVTIYRGTGFHYPNVPDRPILLTTAPSVTVPNAVWVLQALDRQSIKIGIDYSYMVDADYCVIENVYYWITSFNMINDNTCEVFLRLDPLTTIGIQNMIIATGFATRAHTRNDTLFGNVIDEPFTPTEPLQVQMGNTLLPSGSLTRDLQLATSTVSLTDITNTAKTYTDSVSGLSVTVPHVPALLAQTQFVMSLNGTEYPMQLPNSVAYDLSNSTVLTGIQDVRSLGIESCITASYKIGKEYVQSALIEDNGRVGQVIGIDTAADSGITVAYAGVNNMKTLSGQFYKVVLASTSSGDQQTFDIHDIYDANYSTILFRLFADCQPDGRPYARPNRYFNDLTNYTIGTVAGSEWQHIPLSFNQRSGDVIDRTRAARQITQNIVTGSAGVFTSAVTGNAVGAATNAVSTALDTYNTMLDYNIDHVIVAPEIQFARTPSLQNYLGNSFITYAYHLSPLDTIRFDNFLTQFGYACNEVLTVSTFFGRVNFNYVQATGVSIRSPQWGQHVCQQAARLIESGVRVWHTLPNDSAATNNPIA